MSGCDQCGCATRDLTATEYGDLCATCAYRQAELDDANDRFDHLSPSSFGFLSDSE